MNRRSCVGSSDDLEEANSKVLVVKSSAPDESMVRRLKRQMNCFNGPVWWKATARSIGWTDGRKKHSIGSSDGNTFCRFGPTASLFPWPIYTPFTLPFEVAEECETHTRSYPSHTSANLLPCIYFLSMDFNLVYCPGTPPKLSTTHSYLSACIQFSTSAIHYMHIYSDQSHFDKWRSSMSKIAQESL
jgi:hypothetical protein